MEARDARGVILSGGYFKDHQGRWQRYWAPEVGEGEEHPPFWPCPAGRFMAPPANTPTENIMHTVRAKFRCTGKTQDECAHTVTFQPVISGSEENKQFYKYTPGGQLVLAVVKAETAALFEPGNEYYLDFTPAVVIDESKA